MTLEELIKIVDIHLPGNRFDNQMKTTWINEIEGKIYEEIISKTYLEQEKMTAKEDEDSAEEPQIDYAFEIDPLNQRCCKCECKKKPKLLELKPYVYAADKERHLLVQDRFCDVYIHYVLAKMHQADSEIDNYNNEVLLFDASYKDYASWSLRNFKRY